MSRNGSSISIGLPSDPRASITFASNSSWKTNPLLKSTAIKLTYPDRKVALKMLLEKFFTSRSSDWVLSVYAPITAKSL